MIAGMRRGGSLPASIIMIRITTTASSFRGSGCRELLAEKLDAVGIPLEVASDEVEVKTPEPLAQDTQS